MKSEMGPVIEEQEGETGGGGKFDLMREIIGTTGLIASRGRVTYN